ncbi:hypothetical protein JVU11DRAFT_3485 [Chiua virens]|nr:hypothetical protein JVU11DRAFT_3485 [Chiua virens]
MTILDNTTESELVQLLSTIQELSEQVAQNRSLSVSLHNSTGVVKTQAAHSKAGFVLRRFNLDKSQEVYDAELEHMNTSLTAENQMSALRQQATGCPHQRRDVQEHELALIREYEARLLTKESENLLRALSSTTAESISLGRVSSTLRSLLRVLNGEDVPLPTNQNPPSESNNPSPDGFDFEKVGDDWALERECELSRLERENAVLRRLLGLEVREPEYLARPGSLGGDQQKPSIPRQNEGTVQKKMLGGAPGTLFYHRNNHPRPNTSPLSSSEMPQSWLPRRPSPAPIITHSKLKGKDRSHDMPDATSFEVGYKYSPSESPSQANRGTSAEAVAAQRGQCTRLCSKHSLNTFCKDIDNVASKSSESSTSSSPYNPSSHSAPLHSHFHHCSGSLPSRHRAGILSAASDVFGLRRKIGSVSRKKQNFSSLSHSCEVVPEVIEINAHNNTTVTSTVGGTTAHRDYEHEERERLRDAAAQSIGLDPELLHDSFKSESRLSLESPNTPLQPDPIPAFPTTFAALRPSTELSATLPKFTPPSSLLVYALSKQWKSRTIVLTSHSTTQKTHVHLFKSASKDEKEVERLEVTEDSVIFVAEEEVGGRGNVVKFAGKDVSAKRTGETGEDGVRTMWLLQITDSAESQRWISAIKNAVLTQRAVRAGLNIRAETDGRNEPKGDIDVMLSMHLQGLISPQPIKASTAMFPSSPVRTSPSPSPSLRSLRINIPSSPSPTAMKGMFSGRPRSPSVEGSLTPTHPPGHSEDSFGAAGTNLLTMIRSKSSADFSSSQSHSLPLPLPHAPSPAPSLGLLNSPVVIAASDLKISKERDVPEPSIAVPEAIPATTPSSNTPPTPSFSTQGTLVLSLQPPPRKSKHALSTIPTAYPHEQQGMYKQTGGNRSVAGNFGIQSRGSGDDTPRDDISPASPASSNFSGKISGSLSSIPGFDALSANAARVSEQEDDPDELLATLGNTIASSSSSGNRSVPSDKLSHSTAISKRWSRGSLPKQPAPPSGPPPSIPLSSEETQRSSAESSIYVPANNIADLSPSGSSFASQSHTRISGSSSLSPMFWKRASSCSTFSVSSTSTDSRGRTPFGSDSLTSLGPVVAKGATGRPMSLLISGSSASGSVTGKTTKRRSMPPPRPAPNFAPPPAPPAQESTSWPTIHAPAPIKSLRTTVAQRALRFSVASPKPPPSSALPPRPDEAEPAPRHRRTSSTGTLDLHPAPAPPSRPASALSADATPISPASPPTRTLSFRQRLRILSTPPVQAPSLHNLHVSTLDLSNDNEDDLPTPSVHAPQPFGLGAHITATQDCDDPSFLQLLTPITPTIPKPPPRSPFRPSLTTVTSSTTGGLTMPPLELDLDFVSLSPPPPRRGSKPNVVAVARPEKLEAKGSGTAQREDESKLLALSSHGSVVSLGFVTTS